ncbi:hypothetical protein B5X24_HaOG214512 [Helicoverpa armigera]|uniref:MADF domain-containing protein n=1 Tax=Helicoverpa armigera TaxID=29058 RepID=A0A2W1B514_HELAM|nr:hypothetical protein B5X24_HaOG214512 [Helicoverpa armigera]
MAPPDSAKKILEDFIEIYRSNPCLWQIKNKDYHNRDKKEAAYKLLIEKLRIIEPDANKDVVVKKINNLRSNVRKEKKKYEQSLKSGASADDVMEVDVGDRSEGVSSVPVLEATHPFTLPRFSRLDQVATASRRVASASSRGGHSGRDRGNFGRWKRGEELVEKYPSDLDFPPNLTEERYRGPGT